MSETHVLTCDKCGCTRPHSSPGSGWAKITFALPPEAYATVMAGKIAPRRGDVDLCYECRKLLELWLQEGKPNGHD